MQKRMLVIWVPLLALAGSGCSGEDTARLGSIGRTLVARARALSESADGKLPSGWQAARGAVEASALAGHVGARLRWDKALVDTAIEVSADGTSVELKGRLDTQEQKRRAIEIAESTAGVEKVLDSLEMSPPE
jgi:osmotically-inducible protein OsmY